jgi:hypothetical protein
MAAETTIDELEARMARIEGMLAELLERRRTRVVDEVRARRVVVVGSDGFERVVIDANKNNGGMKVYSKEGACNASVTATEECWGGDANVFVVGGGNIQAMMTVNKRGDRHEGEVWVLAPDERSKGATLTHEGVDVDGDS